MTDFISNLLNDLMTQDTQTENHIPASWRLNGNTKNNITHTEGKDKPTKENNTEKPSAPTNDYVTAALSKPPVDSSFNGQYLPLANAPIWGQKRQADAAFLPFMENETGSAIKRLPALAMAWSDMVINYWLDGMMNGTIDRNLPVTLLELGAEKGHFSVLFLRCLINNINTQGLSDMNWQLLISETNAENRQFLATHPDLKNFIANGKVDVVDFDLLNPDLSAYKASMASNPLVVIANDFFSHLPCELFHFQYDKQYQAHIAQEESTKLKQDQLHFQWPLYSVESSQDPILTALLPLYSCYIDNSVIPLPVMTIQAIDRLKTAAEKGLLLLIADRGCTAFTQLKQQKSALEVDEGRVFVPFNFHALQRYSDTVGAELLLEQKRPLGLTIGALLFSDQENFSYSKEALEDLLIDNHPDDIWQLKQGLNLSFMLISDDQKLAHLRKSHYDPEVLSLFLPELLSQGVVISRRLDWCRTLNEVWKHYVQTNNDMDFVFNLGLLATDLGYWRLSKSCFTHCIEWNGDAPAYWHNLALGLLASADEEYAEKCINLASLLNPDDLLAKGLQQDIKAYRAELAKYPTLPKLYDLCLRPLVKHHIAEFLLQYRDPDIAKMANGAELVTAQQVEKYLQDNAQSSQQDYAVIDPDFGVIGVTSLDLKPADNSAHFSFWIGTDYQGLGFAEIAGKLCIQLAQNMSLDYLTTTAWKHNHRSQKVLKKLGFIDITEHQDAPEKHFNLILNASH